MSEVENQSGEKVFVLKKKYVAVFAAVVAVVIIIVSVIFSGPSDKQISIFYTGAESGAVIVRDDSLSDVVLSGKSVASVRYAENKSAAAVLMSEGASYTLYHTDGRKGEKIAANYTNDYAVSPDGRKVMYCDAEKGLYLYDSKSKKTVAVDTQVKKFCLSPSGKAAVYTKSDTAEETMYLYNGSDSVQLAAVYTPLAVSDDGEFIFALKSDNSLYVLDKNGNVTSKICSGVSADKFYITSDMKSIVFNDGSYTYISQNGKSRVRLIPHKAAPVFSGVQVAVDSGSLTVVVSSLTDIFYSAADENGSCSLFYIDKNFNRTDVAGNVTRFIQTGTQNIVYLATDGKIIRYEKGRIETVASGAADMLSDSKGKYVYYTDATQTLYVVKKNAPLLLASGVDKMYITQDDILLFVMTDGRLYSVRRDNNAAFENENVYGCVCNQTATFYVRNYSSHTGKFELFASDSGTNFRQIHENISNII